MEIPSCPNYREGKCDRSDTAHGGETRDGSADIIICRTCKLLWLISKPRTRGRAAHEVHLDRMSKASERLKQQASRKSFLDLGRRM